MASYKNANIVPLTEGADRPHDKPRGKEERRPWQQTCHFPGSVSSKRLSEGMLRKNSGGGPRVHVLIAMNDAGNSEQDCEGNGGTFVRGIEP